jgi:hypothetical protein
VTDEHPKNTKTGPDAGCWEAEARAETSVIDFVVFVCPR